ncbi:hypothetical protein ACWGMW_28965 [Streptomyces albidoflavus]
MSVIEEPALARPWRAEDGPPPAVWTWPAGDRPALEVWSAGAWRYATVMARQDWADGTVRYQVAVDLLGDTSVATLTYQWPQPGLRMRHPSRADPSRASAGRHDAAMPQGVRRTS